MSWYIISQETCNSIYCEVLREYFLFSLCPTCTVEIDGSGNGLGPTETIHECVGDSVSVISVPAESFSP